MLMRDAIDSAANVVRACLHCATFRVLGKDWFLYLECVSDKSPGQAILGVSLRSLQTLHPEE